MLISYPILCGTDLDADPKYVGGVEPPSAKSAPPRVDGAKGLYPVSTSEGWHGGIHVRQPVANQPVRAIADGIVLAYRVPTQKTDDKTHPLNYGGGWTDDGFVLLKHEKECGEGRKVVFYSLYMHLREISNEDLKTLNAGAGELKPSPKKQVKIQGQVQEEEITLKRKASIGFAGSTYGQAGVFHFEIFTDEASLNAFFQPWKGWTDPWGDQYFRVKAGTHYYHQPFQGAPEGDVAGTLVEDMWLVMRYQDGTRIVDWIDENGERLATLRTDNLEYLLYKEALTLYPEHQSRGFELLRFGRVLGPWKGHDDKEPAKEHQHSWLELPTGGWVDIADRAKVDPSSDADFPPFRWTKVEGSKVYDAKTGLCDGPGLLKALDKDGDGVISADEFKTWLTTEANRNVLRKVVVKFKSEWDGRDQSRWEHVKDILAKDPKVKQQALKRQIEWIKALVAYHQQNQGKWDMRLKNSRQRLNQIEAWAKEKAKEKSAQKIEPARKRGMTPEARWEDALASARERFQIVERRVKAVADFLKGAPAKLQGLESQLEEAKKEKADPKLRQLGDEAFNKEFIPHIQKLQFWDKVPGLPDSEVWHFHPLHFVKMFKKCHWLSEGELKLVFPDEANLNQNIDGTSHEVREIYRSSLNRVLWKYGITRPAHMAYFLGQAAVETGCFNFMMEKGNTKESRESESAGYFKNPKEIYFTHVQSYDGKNGNVEKEDLRDSSGHILNPVVVSKIDESKSKSGDGMKFRGRGFLHVTGRANYAYYWVFRGWIKKNSFDDYWWSKVGLKPAVIDDPQKLSIESWSAADSGGWYFTAGPARPKEAPMMKYIKSELRTELVVKGQVKAITHAVNGGENGLDNRKTHTLRLLDLFGDYV